MTKNELLKRDCIFFLDKIKPDASIDDVVQLMNCTTKGFNNMRFLARLTIIASILMAVALRFAPQIILTVIAVHFLIKLW